MADAERKKAAAVRQREIELQKRSGQGAANADRRRMQQEAESVKASRRALKERTAIYKQEKAEERKRNAELARLRKQEVQALHDANREKGLARQRHLQRYREDVAKEAAIGRKSLQQRLELYKKEKAAARKRQVARELTGGGMLGGGMGGMLAGGATMLIGGSALFATKQLVEDSIKMHAQIERNTAAFEVFTGSLGNATSLMGSLRRLSADSGVSFEAMQASATTLLSFGGAVENTIPALKQMANITRGDKERFRALALAYAQVGAAGKLMGQELLQMVNAGFNPLVKISEQTGMSIAQLRDEMRDGNISFEMVKNAFREVTAAGGKYHGMLEKIAETSSGALAKANSQWEIFKDTTGESLESLTKTAAPALTDMLQLLTSIQKTNVFDYVSGSERFVSGVSDRIARLKNNSGLPSAINYVNPLAAMFGGMPSTQKVTADEGLRGANLDKQLKVHAKRIAEHQEMVDRLKEQAAAKDEARRRMNSRATTEGGREEIRSLQIELGIISEQKGSPSGVAERRAQQDGD